MFITKQNGARVLGKGAMDVMCVGKPCTCTYSPSIWTMNDKPYPELVWSVACVEVAAREKKLAASSFWVACQRRESVILGGIRAPKHNPHPWIRPQSTTIHHIGSNSWAPIIRKNTCELERWFKLEIQHIPTKREAKTWRIKFPILVYHQMLMMWEQFGNACTCKRSDDATTCQESEKLELNLNTIEFMSKLEWRLWFLAMVMAKSHVVFLNPTDRVSLVNDSSSPTSWNLSLLTLNWPSLIHLILTISWSIKGFVLLIILFYIQVITYLYSIDPNVRNSRCEGWEIEHEER